MRNKVSVSLLGLYVVFVVLSVAAIFVSDDSLSGVFLVLLGSPWTQLITNVFDSVAGDLFAGNAALGLTAGLMGCAINGAVIYLGSSWVVAKLTSGREMRAQDKATP